MFDIYVLASERSAMVAKQFKDTWLRNFNETAEEYEFPQYADEPLIIYSSDQDLIEKLVEHPDESHSIYWNNSKDTIVRSGMLFFTSDGAMIVGISVANNNSSEIANYLQELGKTVNGRFGYVTFEEPPPDTEKEFIDEAKTSSSAKLIDGSLIV